MMNVFNIAIGLIAIIALILAIIANNKSTINDFSDAKVMGPDGQQVSLGVSLKGYFNQQKGHDFMVDWLNSNPPSNYVLTTKKYGGKISADQKALPNQPRDLSFTATLDADKTSTNYGLSAGSGGNSNDQHNTRIQFFEGT